jgi:hypothetical protein
MGIDDEICFGAKPQRFKMLSEPVKKKTDEC